jgi:hypothetical protein
MRFLHKNCTVTRTRTRVAQTQRKEGSASRKYVSTLYSVHYVKLTLSYAQNLEYSGITVLVMHRQLWTIVEKSLWTTPAACPLADGEGVGPARKGRGNGSPAPIF